MPAEPDLKALFERHPWPWIIKVSEHRAIDANNRAILIDDTDAAALLEIVRQWREYMSQE